MTAKEYLEQVHDFKLQIDLKKSELESYRELSMCVSGCDFTQHCSTSMSTETPFERYSDKIVDLEREIKDDTMTLEKMKFEVGLEIDKVDKIKERIVLRYRYLLLMTWEEVAKKLNYSTRWVTHIHDEAVLSFEKIMEGKFSEL